MIRAIATRPPRLTGRFYSSSPALCLDRALVTDVTAIKSVNGAAAFSRPMFQGKLQADIAVDGPHVATFQIGAYRADAMKAMNS